MRSRYPLAGMAGTNPLAAIYIENFSAVSQWFDYDPHASGTWDQRLAELDAGSWDYRKQTASLAAAQQQRWGAAEAAIQAAAKLAAPQTYMVVTGQQPGLLGGPLLTQLKAVSAILWARQLKQRFPAKDFVPVFWIASADSDLEEVSTFECWDGRAGVNSLRLPHQPNRQQNQTLHTIQIAAAEWQGLLAGLHSALPAGPARTQVLQTVEQAYDLQYVSGPGGLVQGFARWMARLFAGTELVVLDPEELLDRPDIGRLYADQLRMAVAARKVLDERGQGIAQAGLPLQVMSQDDDSQLFYVDEAGFRDKLQTTGAGGLQAKRSGAYWQVERLAEIAETAPRRFTGNALFRPLVESLLFPCAAWIGGQAELSYRAQAQVLFGLHGLKHPPALLRHHGTLLPAPLGAVLEEHRLDLSHLTRPAEEVIQLALAPALPATVASALVEYRRVALKADDALLSVVQRDLPELGQSLRTMRGKLEWHLARVERKVGAALRRREHQLVSRLNAALALARPQGQAQERRLNLLSFLSANGLDLIEQLLTQLTVPCWEHCLIMVDE